MHALSVFALILGLLGSGATHTRAQTCNPSPLGSPCATGGLATLGARELTLSAGAGNPVNAVTGNKYQFEPDWPAHPAAPGIELIRHYNSQDTRPSVLGTGWRLSYDTRLHHAGGRWQIVQADGSRVSPDATHGRLVHHDTGWRWIWPDGRILHFNKQGYLTAIQFNHRPGADVHIVRHTDGPLQHALHEVHLRGRPQLRFHYETNGAINRLVRVDTPLGSFNYRYDTNAHRLVSMTRPDGMKHRYLYEAGLQSGNVHALTGIERHASAPPSSGALLAHDRPFERLGSWTYDTMNRVTRWEPGAGLPGSALAFSYSNLPDSTGRLSTDITSAEGTRTTIHAQTVGERVHILSIEGTGCAGCAAPGLHATLDPTGRLTGLNGLELTRTPEGALASLKPRAHGWPGLHFTYGHENHGWFSTLTGQEQLHLDKQRRPLLRQRANGSRTQVEYDAAGRPIRLVDTHLPGSQQAMTRPPVETTLRWQGRHVVRIQHPHETEHRRYDDRNRLRERRTERPDSTPSDSTKSHRALHERFDYDEHDRLATHHLPEGGRLDYTWHATGRHSAPRLAGLIWTTARGQAHTILSSRTSTPGYTYGNGLHLHTVLNAKGQVQHMLLADSTAPRWVLERTYDTQGRTRQERSTVHDPAVGHDQVWTYAHDTQHRLHGAQGSLVPEPHRPGRTGLTPAAPTDTHTLWYAWDSTGALRARRYNGLTTMPVLERDASGLPTRAGAWELTYGPQQRLIQAERPATAGRSHLRLHYRHNAFGHLISRTSPTATQHFHYLNNQLVAEHDGAIAGTADKHVTRRYLYAGLTLIGLIDYAPSAENGSAALYFVHSDLIGAPRLITDADKRIRWAADYTPTGQAQILHADLTLELRRPGQRRDPDTGWHDNLLRTYDPDYGHYLEPDPLGPLPGSQALGYARQQPQTHVDPLGLVLFAFDGTRQDTHTQSNVWKLVQAYRDGPTHYQNGPGNSYYIDWDALTAVNAGRLLENQWQHFLNQVERHQQARETLTVDIVGFSRGAALARHFGNQINGHVNQGLFNYNDPLRGTLSACIDLRFMGLFDTVAQFGMNGVQNHNYDLTIASAWQWVAHAVALQEHRHLFPVSSAADTGATNVVEAPFVGAHADIGGGVQNPVTREPAAPGTQAGDLSDITLNWMAWQAMAVQVNLDLAQSDRSIDTPLIHDERSALLRSLHNGDRSVLGAAGHLQHAYQQDHLRLGAEARTQTEAIIQRHENWRRQDSRTVGTVDLDGYARWLHDEVGWRPGPA